jgi:hypothetical protein
MKNVLISLSLLLLAAVGLRGQEFFVPPFTVEAVEFRTTGQQYDYWHPLMKVVEAHQRNRGAKAVVFVLDTGAEFDHEDLSTAGNRFGLNATPEPPRDGHGHSHMVGGVVGMLNNDVGGVGMAPDALLIPVKVMRNSGAGFSAEIAAGIRLVADASLGEFNEHIRIINMSFGGGAPMADVEAALKYAEQKGCILMASAGNSGYSEGSNTIGWPARYEFVTSIASIGQTFAPSWFSSGGPGLDVTAFGEHLELPNNQKGYGKYNGTSFSGPMIAGLGALIVTEHYEAFRKAGAQANALMQKHLRQHATDLGAPGPDPRFGYGLPDALVAFKPVPGVPDTPPPPTGPPTFRTVRTLTIPLPGKYETIWRAGNETAFRKAFISLTVHYTSKFTAPYALDNLSSATERWFRNRGFVLLNGDDLAEASYWVRHFYEMMLKNEGFPVRVQQLVFSDEQGRTLHLNELDRRSSTAVRSAATRLRLNEVRTVTLRPE